jgi:hypothetical protein
LNPDERGSIALTVLIQPVRIHQAGQVIARVVENRSQKQVAVGHESPCMAE